MEIINNHEPSPRLNPLNDYLFFKVMGEKGDEPQLLGFLNAVLGRSGREPIESLEIEDNTSFEKDIISGKSCILDVLAVLHNGTKVNIEVQLSNQYNMERRSLFYWSKVYYQSLNEGQKYQKLPNVIAVNIVGYDFPRNGGVHTRFSLREDADPSLILSPALEIHFVNMVQWRKLREKDIASNPLHRWLTWFDEESSPELVEEVLSMDSAIMAASERQDFVIQDEAAFRTYWSRRGAEHDRISNLEGAREEGEEKKAIEIARKMKEMGDPIERIHTITGLPTETIERM